MKIKKEFVDLIYNRQKRYEFRNSSGKSGVYQIKDKLFQLKRISTKHDFKIKQDKEISGEINYYFCGYEITEQEYNWVKNNIDYFVLNDNDTYIVIYEWEELEQKELEVVV